MFIFASIFSCHQCIINKETEDGFFFVVYRIYKISDELKCIYCIRKWQKQ